MVVPEARTLAEREAVLGAGTPLRRFAPSLGRAGGTPTSSVARRLRRAVWVRAPRLAQACVAVGSFRADAGMPAQQRTMSRMDSRPATSLFSRTTR